MSNTIKVTVTGDCGKAHGTIREWEECKECDVKAKLATKRKAMTDDSLDDVAKANADEGKQNVYAKEIWNAAIEAAAKCVIKAPVFPKGDYGGPKADAERIQCLSAVEADIRKLKK